MAKDKGIDLAKAAERLDEAQDVVKLTGAAYQSCTKAWNGIRGPNEMKRQMWKATEAARAGWIAAVQAETKHFGVMHAIVEQGDLFNGEGDEAGSPDPASPQGPVGGPGTGIARRGRRPPATPPAN